MELGIVPGLTTVCTYMRPVYNFEAPKRTIAAFSLVVGRAPAEVQSRDRSNVCISHLPRQNSNMV